ncbi:MAG TPA: hypothetical protein VH300_11905 [Thermoleophilaceae bacterium]|jgi:hypothetical protein|nr:hypothetical protein [Thermoleophilaceae bacterium]
MPDRRILGGAAAGAVAAAVWAAQEPLDMRIFRVPYSDAELVSKPLGASRRVGSVIHMANGALFGAVYAAVGPHVPGPGWAKGSAAGMTEHLATWPLVRFLPHVKLWGNHRAFAQAVWRHLLFGAILGVVEERLAAGYADGAPA